MNLDRQSTSFLQISRSTSFKMASCLLLLIGTSSLQAQTLTGLGDLPGGSFSSQADGVSNDGSVVVGRSSSGSGTEAFRWTSSGGMVGLGDIAGGGFGSVAFSSSFDGSVIAGIGFSVSGGEAFVWTNGGGIVGLGDLAGGNFSSEAHKVSSDGTAIVGFGSSGSGREAFRWTNGGGMVGLGDLSGGSFDSVAEGASNDGSIVVGRSISGPGSEAFRWTIGGGMVGLGDLPGGSFGSFAFGVSSDGTVIVGGGASGSGNEAFRWTNGGGMVGLGDLPGGSFSSSARDVSSDGSVVVGESTSGSGVEAFIWTAENGMQKLATVLTDFGIDLSEWSSLSRATGVSDNGRVIVGWGTRLGNTEAWVADLSIGLHWTNTGSGDWDDGTNWTGGFFTPGEFDNALLDPQSGLTVFGPNDVTTVASLLIGAQTAGTASFEIQPTGNMSVTGMTTIASRGRLAGDGTFAALAGIDNQGEIDLGTSSLQITGGTVQNNGLIRGDGQIDSTLDNSSTGEVRVEDGRVVLLTGSGNTNSGEINLLGGTLDVQNGLSNTATGFIAGDGNLFADAGLINDGVLAFAGNLTRVFGDVNNQPGATIVTSGFAETIFFDDVVHNGTEIRTNSGSSTVIFGAASGAGPYTGTGNVFMDGDLRPGNSPATVTFDGGLSLGTLTTTEIEIGGLSAGTEYDQLMVAGDLSLSGTLNVVLINPFELASKQQFTIVEVGGNLIGNFAGLNEGDVVGTFGSTDLKISYSGGDGNDVVLFTEVDVLLGDVNLDGVVNLLDVSPFVTLLSTGTFQAEADINQDGIVNLLDVEPFVVLLSGG